MPHRRVVITGIGQHTPFGPDPVALFDGLLADRSATTPMPEWSEIEGLTTLVAAPVVGFDGAASIDRKFRRTMGRLAQLASAAAAAAVADAKLSEEDLASGRCGVVFGSTMGSGGAESEFWSHFVPNKTARAVKSTLFFQAMSHTCAANIALLLGIEGEVLSTNAACASSNQAIGIAADRIRHGSVDMAVAGGAEELHVTGAVIFQALSAATTGFNDRPSSTPRPFDKNRDGIVVGEGAGVLLLEDRERALARGARIYGEILGHGTSCDARNMANPAAKGMISAIAWALRDAHCEPARVDYVNAHATGTRAGDAAEAEALMQTVGDRVPVSSSKGHLGHLLGACGVVEAIICLEAMRRGIAPGTRNLEEPDVAPIALLRAPVERTMHRVLNTNFAFGGINSVLLLGSEAVARDEA